MMIPKIIHQTWKTSTIPENLYKRDWVESWRRHHTEWEFRLSTDYDNRRLISEHYPWFLKTYDGYDQNIKRVDAWRYFALHKYGGLYVDLDFECFKPIDPLLAGRDLVLSYRNQQGGIANAIMASAPGHPFWEIVWALLEENRDLDVLRATGPLLMTQAYRSCERSDITVLQSKYFWQYSYKDYKQAIEPVFSDEAYGTHRYVTVWKTKKKRKHPIRVRLARLVSRTWNRAGDR